MFVCSQTTEYARSLEARSSADLNGQRLPPVPSAAEYVGDCRFGGTDVRRIQANLQ